MPYEEYLMMLNVPPSLEEAMVDCLLTFEAEDGFNSFPVYAHDHRNFGLSLAEQVSGRQKQIRFQMFLPEKQLKNLKQILQRDFANSGIRYRVLPVIEQGYF